MVRAIPAAGTLTEVTGDSTIAGGASEVLVETGWVEDALGDPGLCLVEVDEDTTSHTRGHVPGALAWHWRDDLRHPLRRDMVDQDAVTALLRRSGVGPETTVVLYGGNANWFAAYAYWLLRQRGFDRVRLMDGGRRKWELEGRRLTRTTREVPHAEPGPLAPVREELRAGRDLVLARLDDPGTVLVDVRAPAEFHGEMLAPPHLPQEQAQVPGHIPGAVNVPWFASVREDGAFRTRDELRAVFDHAGVTPDKECIVYCRIGERGSHTWFVLHELLGYPAVRHYDGAWTEYGSLIGVPVAR